MRETWIDCAVLRPAPSLPALVGFVPLGLFDSVWLSATALPVDQDFDLNPPSRLGRMSTKMLDSRLVFGYRQK